LKAKDVALWFLLRKQEPANLSWQSLFEMEFNNTGGVVDDYPLDQAVKAWLHHSGGAAMDMTHRNQILYRLSQHTAVMYGEAASPDFWEEWGNDDPERARTFMRQVRNLSKEQRAAADTTLADGFTSMTDVTHLYDGPYPELGRIAFLVGRPKMWRSVEEEATAKSGLHPNGAVEWFNYPEDEPEDLRYQRIWHDPTVCWYALY